MIATKNGIAARFASRHVTCTGRLSRGVRGIRLGEGDEVCGAAVIRADMDWQRGRSLVTVTERGYGKRMAFDLFDAKGRGIKGVICQNVTEKTGRLCGISIVGEGDDLMMMTDEGIMIRTTADGIPEYGRGAAGVIIMRVADGASIVNFAVSPAAEEASDETDAPADESAPSGEVENPAEDTAE